MQFVSGMVTKTRSYRPDRLMLNRSGAFLWTVASAMISVVLFLGHATAQDSPWRSSLYPEDWSPDHTDTVGRFLPDFSYAGYHNGEAPLPKVKEEVVIDVVKDFGADPSGAKDSSPAFRSAIETVTGDRVTVIYVPEGLYRCDAPFTIHTNNTVLRGEGPRESRLFFTSHKKMRGRGHIMIRGKIDREANILLTSDGMNRSFSVAVRNSEGLSVGDDVTLGWTVTDAFVEEHHMKGTWRVFNGKWRPIFHRTVVGITESKGGTQVELDIPLRYPAHVRDGASLQKESGFVRESGIEDLGIATAVAWADAWAQPAVQAITLQGVKNCWVRNVHSFPSPLPKAKGYHLQNGGILVVDSKNVTVAECTMAKAQNRGGGGSGYLFQVSRSGEILTRDCEGIAGRHNFIQNWDFGTSGCVWLRCASSEGRGFTHPLDPIGYAGDCEYHHSLAMACLVDSCQLDDGWFGGNRHNWSSGAGNTVTQSVYWNTSGKGRIRSWQAGNGYIIGTEGVSVQTGLSSRYGKGTAPEDFSEGIGKGSGLAPLSLYEDQLRRRLKRNKPRAYSE